MPFFEYLWCLALLVLTGYHLVVFRLREKAKPVTDSTDLPGVSIVICVKNGVDILIQHLPSLCMQDYPTFEIIIVDDHSELQEKQKLEEAILSFPQITLHHAVEETGKKAALSLGISKASYDHILVTDADCRPNKSGWIKSMVTHSVGQDIVLGYSPYQRLNGLLNKIIRFETVMTGIQYLSWAMLGRPYMGVGRNMMYSRDLFLKINPYKNHWDIPYGDDDLWLQQAVSVAEVKVNLNKASFMMSLPETSWRSWLRQKHRHLSAGHHYDKTSLWLPGGYAFALIVHWLVLPIILIFCPQPQIIGLATFGLFVRWFTYAHWTQRLGDRDTLIWYPLFEVIYATYLAVMGMITLVAKKKKWS